MERCRILRQNRQFSHPRLALPRLFGAATVALAALVLHVPAQAEEVGRRVHGQLVDVRILVDGTPTALYARAGDASPRYFEAARGDNYALELRNRTSRRLGVLIAVDGLNVITGGRSALGAHESIYVLDPRERTVIRGWRTSLDDVQQFVFVDEERSYAARSGQSNAGMGWIHVLTFEERQPVAVMRLALPGGKPGWSDLPPTAPLDESRSDRDVEGASGSDERTPSAARDSKTDASAMERQAESKSFPGTGWGEHRRDRVVTTTFDAIELPVDHLTFRYEYADGLRALGLLPARHRLDERETGELGFAQPPRW